ncbi:MAG1430 family protein [Mycoplasmopsis synoviae]|uniref:Uncharacterized protein n=2 Tax=Mycoplasmopsis synoviae TaxID=2109 RepID=A0AAX3EZG9_MYCSY|nr:hypothetical protein [Mycoplasmopsis synoviae]QGL45349.1 hypothetical protein EJ916_02645 [Mycoplasmopsis synoviae]ULL02390.1 hypothetical protein JM201_03410 [Mycoplasmopsis synoviae]UZW64425.1 hypothetical protein OIE46_03590 [Mycoplasmopsis synoviae]
MKKLKFKYKLILLLLSAAATLSATVGVSVLAFSKVQNTKEVNRIYYQEQNINTIGGSVVTLDNFVFNASARVKNYYANSFSNHRIYNSANSGYDSTPNYWSKLLTFSKAPTLAELQSKDFTLMTPDGIFLNYYLGAFQISFDSFSDELNGTLYLQVTLTSKTNPANVITKVFEASGFKKVSEDSGDLNLRNLLSFNSVNLNFTYLDSFKNLDDFKAQYTSGAATEKLSMIQSAFNFETSTVASVDFLNSSLVFDDNNDLKFNLRLTANVPMAIPTNLDQKVRLDNIYLDITTQSYSLLKDYFAAKVVGDKLSFATDGLDKYTIEDIKKSFDLLGANYALLNVNNLPVEYNLKFIDIPFLNPETNEYEFIYNLYLKSAPSQLVYTAKLSLPKTALKAEEEKASEPQQN